MRNGWTTERLMDLMDNHPNVCIRVLAEQALRCKSDMRDRVLMRLERLGEKAQGIAP